MLDFIEISEMCCVITGPVVYISSLSESSSSSDDPNKDLIPPHILCNDLDGFS